MERVILFCLLCGGLAGGTWGLEFSLTPPVLTDANPEFATSINQAVEASQGEMEILLTQALTKPLFMQAFAGASARLEAFPGPWTDDPFTFGLRTSGTLEIDSWDWAEVEKRFQGLNESTDYPWGAGFQPLWIEGRYAWALTGDLKVLVGGGFNVFDVRQPDFSVSGGGGRLLGGLVKPGHKLAGWCLWEGWKLEGSLGWQTFQVITEIPLDPVYETAYIPSPFPFTPDQPVTVIVIPQVQAGIRTEGWSLPLLFSSALTLVDQFTFQAGAGLVFSSATSALLVDGQAEVTFLPEDRGLITDSQGQEHPGLLTVRGTVGATPGPGVQALLTAGFQVRFGSFFLHLPVQWKPSHGLGLTFEAGASF